jgi:hypothetical protein
MNSSQVRRLRATWYCSSPHRETIDNEYFHGDSLYDFAAGDWGIRDYLLMTSDSVLLSWPFSKLTERIYKFTNKLVEDGIAKWETNDEYGDVELYKNGYDPEKWAQCCIAVMIEPLYQERVINSKYAIDLFAIYKLGLKTIQALGYDYHDLDILRGLGLNSGTKIAKLYLYYTKYGELAGWPNSTAHKNDQTWMGTFESIQHYDVDWYSDPSIMKKCKKLDAEKGCTKYTTNRQAPKVFCDDYAVALNKACREAKLNPFEKRGFVAEVSPAILRELIEKYKTKYPPEFRQVIRKLLRNSDIVTLSGMTLDDIFSYNEK